MTATEWPETAVAPSRFTAIVDAVHRGDSSGLPLILDAFSTGVRQLLSRRAGVEASENDARSVLMAVAYAIRRGEISDPQQLPALVRAEVLRAAAQIGGTQPRGAGQSSDENVQRHEGSAAMKQFLRSLSTSERDALIAHYTWLESEEEILRKTGVTPARQRVLRFRARSFFGGELPSIIPDYPGTKLARAARNGR